jgi:hypothetical protein
MFTVFIVFAIAILYFINQLTTKLCDQKQIPEERQPKLFRNINVLITILLISSYVEVTFTY